MTDLLFIQQTIDAWYSHTTEKCVCEHFVVVDFFYCISVKCVPD